jgi:hypothetical protein
MIELGWTPKATNGSADASFPLQLYHLLISSSSGTLKHIKAH